MGATRHYPSDAVIGSCNTAGWHQIMDVASTSGRCGSYNLSPCAQRRHGALRPRLRAQRQQPACTVRESNKGSVSPPTHLSHNARRCTVAPGAALPWHVTAAAATGEALADAGASFMAAIMPLVNVAFISVAIMTLQRHGKISDGLCTITCQVMSEAWVPLPSIHCHMATQTFGDLPSTISARELCVPLR